MKINKLISAVTAGLSLLTITASSVLAVGVNNGGEALTDHTTLESTFPNSSSCINCDCSSF